MKLKISVGLQVGKVTYNWYRAVLSLERGGLGFCVLIIKYSAVQVKASENCNHSKESYFPVLFCGTVYYAVQGDSNF